MKPGSRHLRITRAARALAWLGLACAGASLATAPVARATPAELRCGGVSFPDRVVVDGAPPLVLNGVGLREVTPFAIDVYVAALYLEQARTRADAILATLPPMQLVVHFVRDVERARLVESFTREIPREAPGDEAVAGGVARLPAMMRDMRAGDAMTFSFVPGRGLTVAVRQDVGETIEGDAFAHWIGERPPSLALREGLLGGRCG